MTKTLLVCIGIASGLSACVESSRRPVSISPYISAAVGGKTVTNSRSELTLTPLGSIPTDGFTLPLISPDSRWLAASVGTPPSWPVLLAQGAEPTARPGGVMLEQSDASGGDDTYARSAAEIRVYSLISPKRPAAESEAPPAESPANARSPAIPSPTARRLSLPLGTTLGRSADADGFLVERPQPVFSNVDAPPPVSRALGVVDWETGKLKWMVDQPGVVAAFGTFLPVNPQSPSRRLVAYSRASTESDRFRIAVQSTADPHPQATFALDDATLVFPFAGTDPQTIYVFALPNAVVRVPKKGDTPSTSALTRPAILTLRLDEAATAITEIARSPAPIDVGLAGAYQAIAPLQTPWPAISAQSDGPAPLGAAFFSTDRFGLIWIDASGGLTPLPRGTVSAAPIFSREQPLLALATDRSVQIASTPSHDTPVSSTSDLQVRSKNPAPLPRGPWSFVSSPLLSGAFILRTAGSTPQIRGFTPEKGDKTAIGGPNEASIVLFEPSEGSPHPEIRVYRLTLPSLPGAKNRVEAQEAPENVR